jgi:hypothetical protein
VFKSKIYSREDLKHFFRNGEIPTENHFANLIESMLNKQDDGFSKDDENGLIIASRGSSNKFVTLYKNIDDLNPFFYIEKDERETAALRFTPSLDKNEEKEEQNSFFFHVNGSVGIGARSNGAYKLQVNGFAGFEGRVGTYVQGQVPSDGNWHSIIEGLDNCQAFEIIARTGKKGSGKFAILHAHALSAFGRSRSRIRKVSAHYGSFWNKIRIRWKSKGTHDYALQLRTARNYGKDVYIHYKVSKLWDDEKFLPEAYYY